MHCLCYNSKSIADRRYNNNLSYLSIINYKCASTIIPSTELKLTIQFKNFKIITVIKLKIIYVIHYTSMYINIYVYLILYFL